MFIALLVLGADGDPSRFGNSTDTTVWIGGNQGIGNFTGWIKSGSQINASNNICVGIYCFTDLVFNISSIGNWTGDKGSIQGDISNRILNATLSNYMQNSTTYAAISLRVLNTTLSNYMLNSTVYSETNTRVLNTTLSNYMQNSTTYGAISLRILNTTLSNYMQNDTTYTAISLRALNSSIVTYNQPLNTTNNVTFPNVTAKICEGTSCQAYICRNNTGGLIISSGVLGYGC